MWKEYYRLWAEVTAFFTQERWMELSTDALEQYLGHPISESNALDQMELQMFYEWFIWDYHIQGQHSADMRVYDYFLDQIPQTLTKNDQAILRNWRQSHLSPYQVVQVNPDHAEVMNLITGERFRSICWSDSLQVGDIFLGRFVMFDSVRRIPTPSIVAVSQEAYSYLQKRIEYAFSHYQGHFSNFCREYGYLFVSWMDEVVDLISKNVLIFEVLSYRKVLRRLLRGREFALVDDQVVNLRGPITFRYQTSSGTGDIIVDEDELLLSTEEIEVMDKGRQQFLYSFADCLDFLEESSDDPERQDDYQTYLDYVETFQWPRVIDYEVALLLVINFEAERREQMYKSIQLWYDFCSAHRPNYRKPGVWAAAVDYAMQEINAHPIVKGALQQKYGVSISSLDSRYKQLKTDLQLVIGDFRYSTLR